MKRNPSMEEIPRIRVSSSLEKFFHTVAPPSFRREVQRTASEVPGKLQQPRVRLQKAPQLGTILPSCRMHRLIPQIAAMR